MAEVDDGGGRYLEAQRVKQDKHYSIYLLI